MSKALDDLSHHLLGRGFHTLEADEREVVASIAKRQPVAQDAGDVDEERSTRGERLADKVAAVGGSWAFIIGFTVVLLAWMLLNSAVLAELGLAFDVYPFIFLNLMLSTLAAIQAPVIMMSQNRQAAKDRLTAKLDYQTNLRAELEIMAIHEKIDREILIRLDAISARLDAMEK